MSDFTLVVTSWPPTPCGIAAYAEQQVARLRSEGRVTDVWALGDGDGDWTGDLARGFTVFRRLWWRLFAYREVFLHYVPSFYYDLGDRRDRLRTSLALWLLAILHGRRMTFVIHETDYRLPEAVVPMTLRMRVDRAMWRRVRVLFHSERERDAFLARYRLAADPERYQAVAHDRDFVPRCDATREQAREALALPQDATILLCIGFVQPHKGFDRVVRALKRVDDPKLLLRVVGSVRIAWEPALEAARELHRLCADDPRARFVEKFVSNEEFDTWIVASDYVVVPYREIWSSSVAARARLLGRPSIVSDAGALPEQMGPESHKFGSDEELVEVLRGIAGRHGGS